MVRAPPTPTWHTAHTHRAPTLRSLCFPARLGSPLTLFSRSLCVLRSQVQPKALTNPAVPADQIPALLSTRQDAEHTDHVAGGGGYGGGADSLVPRLKRITDKWTTPVRTSQR